MLSDAVDIIDGVLTRIDARGDRREWLSLHEARILVNKIVVGKR